jgi:hypothetical protein
MVFLVCGRTGEYSDAREWRVKAFRDKARAAKLVTDATQKSNELYAVEDYWEKLDGQENEFDPCWQRCYTGTTYWLEELELDEVTP